MGRREEALQATQEAVDLYRRLAEQHPDAFLPDLAASLNNLGARLSEMGRRAEALQATQEAVDLYRRLAEQHPDAFLPDLAASLAQPGRSGFPKWAGGRRPCKPRRRRWTSTAGWPPSTPTPSSHTWRVSLHNLGARIFPKWAGGRRPCKPRRRRWTSTAAWPNNTPTPSSPTWPPASTTWAPDLSELGRRAEALQATQEAVEIRRRLAAQHPDAFLSDLAAPGRGSF
jgi:tetratricopeptide (TPR) repeat protein